MSEIDPNKPVRLLRLINDRGNPYYPGQYNPGELPKKYLVAGLVSQDSQTDILPKYNDTLKTQKIDFSESVPTEKSVGFDKPLEPVIDTGNPVVVPPAGEATKIEVNTVVPDQISTVFGQAVVMALIEAREVKKFANLPDLKKRVQIEGFNWDTFSDRIVF